MYVASNKAYAETSVGLIAALIQSETYHYQVDSVIISMLPCRMCIQEAGVP